MTGLGRCHVSAAGTADIESFPVSALTQDNEYAGNGFGDPDSKNRPHFWLGLETPEERPCGVETLRPSLRLRGLLEQRRDKPERGN